MKNMSTTKFSNLAETLIASEIVKLGAVIKEKIKYKKVIQEIKLKLQNKNKIKFLRVLILLKKIKLISEKLISLLFTNLKKRIT